MLCQVCNTRERRYKCPKCLLPYCSVDCWKTHKGENCQHIPIVKEASTDVTTKSSYHYITENTVPADKLKLLENSDGLKDILHNPHVRNMLLAIDKSENPSEDMESAMQEPIFVEFVDECLNIVEPPKEQ